MSIVAGMDLGYGSQIKVVTSNYFLVNAAAAPQTQLFQISYLPCKPNFGTRCI